MEYKLIYNTKGKKYYLYHDETFLCDFDNHKEAVKEFTRVVEESSQNKTPKEIAKEFGWTAVDE